MHLQFRNGISSLLDKVHIILFTIAFWTSISTYSSLLNKRTGPNKRTGLNFDKNQISVQGTMADFGLKSDRIHIFWSKFQKHSRGMKY